MKKKTRFLATALATAMCATSILGLVACSKDAGDMLGELGEQPGEAGVYTITLDANGGTFASSFTTRSYQTTNGKLTDTLPDATKISRTGYTFGGWYTAASGGSLAATYTFDADGTIYARWTAVQNNPTDPNNPNNPTDPNNPNNPTDPNNPNTPSADIVITFDANGGTLVGDATVTANAEGKITGAPTATREGYEFLGWGEEDVSNPIQDLTNKTFTASCTLYAQWGGGGDDVTWNDTRVTVESGFGNNGHNDIQKIYLVGKFGNMTAFDNTKGYFMECTAYIGENNYECNVTVDLKAGDIVAIYVPGWPYTIPFSAIENPDSFIMDNDGYMVTEDGTYTFYYKHYWGDTTGHLEHSIYIAKA